MGASIKAGGGSGGRRGKRRAKHAPMSEINVTPFVDVMLVLLIIFMVTAPMMATGIQLDLPSAAAKQLDTPKKEPLLVSISKDGKIYLGSQDKESIPLADLRKKMEAIGEQRGGKDDPVQINGDKGTEYGIISQVIAQVSAAGFKKMALRTDPTSGG